MRRVACAARPDWRAKAAECGFGFHTIDDAPYWDESAYYAFSLRQIEQDIEAPSEELHAMALDMVERIVGSEQHMQQLAIPEPYRDWIAQSWRQRDPTCTAAWISPTTAAARPSSTS
jgi:glutathionylspermidine synthase